METTTNTLQAAIEARAKEAVNKRIDNFLRLLSHDHELVGRLNEIVKVKVKSGEQEEEASFHNVFYYHTNKHGTLMKHELFQALLPEAIRKATDEFINKVDSMRSELDNLLANQQDND